MDKAFAPIWSLPARIDSGSASDMQRHIENVLQLDGGTQLVLDLQPLALFDFHGAGLLLDLIAQARMRNIRIIIQTKNESLIALLRFMQIDLLADIRRPKKENMEMINVKNS